MASRGHRRAHKHSYVPKTSSKIRKGYRKSKNKAKTLLRKQAKKARK